MSYEQFGTSGMGRDPVDPATVDINALLQSWSGSWRRPLQRCAQVSNGILCWDDGWRLPEHADGTAREGCVQTGKTSPGVGRQPESHQWCCPGTEDELKTLARQEAMPPVVPIGPSINPQAAVQTPTTPTTPATTMSSIRSFAQAHPLAVYTSVGLVTGMLVYPENRVNGALVGGALGVLWHLFVARAA